MSQGQALIRAKHQWTKDGNKYNNYTKEDKFNLQNSFIGKENKHAIYKQVAQLAMKIKRFATKAYSKFQLVQQ